MGFFSFAAWRWKDDYAYHVNKAWFRLFLFQLCKKFQSYKRTENFVIYVSAKEHLHRMVTFSLITLQLQSMTSSIICSFLDIFSLEIVALLNSSWYQKNSPWTTYLINYYFLNLQMTVYPKGVSVLMPGESIPTFLAHPAPPPCPPECVVRPVLQWWCCELNEADWLRWSSKRVVICKVLWTL